MRNSAINFQSDTRISVQPIILVFYVCALAVFTAGTAANDMPTKLTLSLFAVYIFAASSGIGHLSSRSSTAAKWAVLFLLESMLMLSTDWLGTVPVYAGAFLIPALAAVLIGLDASAVMAMIQSGLLLAFTLLKGEPDTSIWLIGALLSCWAIYGILSAAYKPIGDVVEWAEEVYAAANETLEQLRDKRAEYEQTVAELKGANAQLNSLNKLTQNLRQIAETERSAKAQFVANVSHELRTPLNMIMGYTEMITQSPRMYNAPLPGALLADLAVVQRNAEQLSRLVNDVLDMSQIESDQMALTRESVDFREMIEFVIAAVTPLFKRKNLYLHHEIHDDIHYVFCDRTRIQEVLLNILSNAGRFTEQGGVIIRASINDENLIVSVTDTGPGIAKPDLDRLFKPFEQLDARIRREYGGSGLGLAISKKFVEMHDGRIWVESQIALGTTFFISLPLLQHSQAANDHMRLFSPHLHYEPRLSSKRGAEQVANQKAFVMEQGDVLGRLITRYMSDVEVLPMDFEQRRAELSIDLLLVNQKLDMLDPAALRQLAQDTGMLVIACSIPDTDERAQSLGVNDILVKPVSRERLLQTLESRGITDGSVLIVDDEPDACQLFARMLSADDQNFSVMTANDGAEALRILEALQPRVILLDLVMPTMNGVEFLAVRASRPDLQRIPVILMSANEVDSQPLVSRCITMTTKNDISVSRLMKCLRAVMPILSTTADTNDPMQRGDLLE
ncbi:MAG: response regulator [Chloroflexi bacterium]|uniref:ATP-binding protein n=1 Tax=Candidatus Flexifilum breve TaxID=3140694 RepID=UPI003136AD58|nr:response regulator [Chloroflexota bacterium]